MGYYEIVESMASTQKIRIIDAFAATNVGFVRGHNEDAVISDPDRGIFLIADGMGGHPGGEVASAIASQTAHTSLAKSISGTNPKTALRAAFRVADQAVKAHGRQDASVIGMGSTLVVLLIRSGQIWVAHSGDSRAYLYRGNLARLTNDHGEGHVISRAIGVAYGNGPDVNMMQAQRGDVLMLCSDGLSAYVDGNLIGKTLKSVKTCKKACWELIDHAMEVGAPDNVTVVVVRLW